MIEVGDHVTVGHTGEVHWVVKAIESVIQPLGVILSSGLTGRIRRDSYPNLHLYRKGVTTS